MSENNISNIKCKAIGKIVELQMLEGVSKVYVATSGGADSMAMLAFFNDYRNTFNIEIGAVHVNHGIRGDTADRDAKFVESYCKKNNIEYILFDANEDNITVPSDASEEWARQLRYGYFKTLERPGVRIATAHTLSDQTETIIFRLARGGSGLNGMAGIPAKRGSYIRPFIGLTRAEIEDLVEYYGTSNITDESNLTDDYSRNKVRHHVVPVLKEINPKAEESVGKFCERINKAQKFISDTAEGKLCNAEIINNKKYDVTGFFSEYDIIVEEMLVKLLTRLGCSCELYIDTLKKGIESARHAGLGPEIRTTEVNISDDTCITVTTKYITVHKSNNSDIEDSLASVNNGDNTNEFGYALKYSEITYDEFKHTCKTKYDLCNYADASKIDVANCIVRCRREGDKFTPACKTGGKVSKFMKDIPYSEKDSIPMIEYNGKIIWMWGVGFTNGFTPTEKSEKIIHVEWFKA